MRRLFRYFRRSWLVGMNWLVFFVVSGGGGVFFTKNSPTVSSSYISKTLSIYDIHNDNDNNIMTYLSIPNSYRLPAISLTGDLAVIFKPPFG